MFDFIANKILEFFGKYDLGNRKEALPLGKWSGGSLPLTQLACNLPQPQIVTEHQPGFNQEWKLCFLYDLVFFFYFMHILCVSSNCFWLWTYIFARKMADLQKNIDIQENRMEVHNSHMIVTWDHLDQLESGLPSADQSEPCQHSDWSYPHVPSFGKLISSSVWLQDSHFLWELAAGCTFSLTVYSVQFSSSEEHFIHLTRGNFIKTGLWIEEH